ncbi:MAG TPA: hypothetical protein VK446_10515 [Methylocystis sp.]|nr:hypothetical protein [Methylocystis sp.]
MRHPFFNLTQLVLREGESDFALQHQAQGLVATLGPRTAIFARPGATVSRWPGAKSIARQSPHEIPERGWLGGELNLLLRMLMGGGDVKVSRIVTLDKQREVLLSAGSECVVEKIDLAELARDGAPSLLFLQPSYLCSSARVVFTSLACDPSTASWARAPYVYRAARPADASRPAILCLSGHTMIWSERLEPGDSRDFALGNVIAATTNLTSRLRPTSQCHPDDYKAEIFGKRPAPRTDSLLERLRGFMRAMATLFDSMRAREGFFVCEMTNHSQRPAFVYVQLNRLGFYGGSGLIGLALRLLSAFFRASQLAFGH